MENDLTQCLFGHECICHAVLLSAIERIMQNPDGSETAKAIAIIVEEANRRELLKIEAKIKDVPV